jgi:hypothetical protein
MIPSKVPPKMAEIWLKAAATGREIRPRGDAKMQSIYIKNREVSNCTPAP